MLEWIGKYYNFGRREGRDVSRWEMYQRTVGYAADGVGFLGFSSCFVVPVYAVGALWNPEAAIEMLPVILTVMARHAPCLFWSIGDTGST